MGPRAGGTEFEYEGESYTVVTPTSPLGRAVMGKRAGDTVELMVGRRLQPHRIETTF
jgi:transcription elongation GreA/GreB family factor